MKRLSLEKINHEKLKKLCENDKISKSLWSIQLDDAYDLEDIKLITLDNKEIALIETSYLSDHPDYIFIDTFEVFEKNKGYGTLIIRLMYDEIKGDLKIGVTSLASAIKFWNRFDMVTFFN